MQSMFVYLKLVWQISTLLSNNKLEYVNNRKKVCGYFNLKNLTMNQYFVVTRVL
jgi:hypothetical protein